MTKDPYKALAERLDALPQGFPPTEDGAELRLLAKIFEPGEAALVAQLRLTLETPTQVAERIGGEARELRPQLKALARRRVISAGRAADGPGLGFGLMPFAVGIYEMQFHTMDAEMARLFEDYYQKVFHQALVMKPQIHRVIPVGESVPVSMEVRPYESAASIVDAAKAWGVVDCICRKQKALIGDPCEHPLDVCMSFSRTPGAFDTIPEIRALTKEEAMATLRRAADAGLVHSVSNSQRGLDYPALGGLEGLWYICNCCTCSCGILRGMAEMGIANVVARSAFVNRVDEDLCVACGICVDSCQFDALRLDETLRVIEMSCVGCGVCVLTCPEGALELIRRPEGEVPPPQLNEDEWMRERAAERGLDMSEVQ